MGSESKQWSQTNQQRTADISTSLISPHCINPALPSPCLHAACHLCPPPYSLSRNPLWSVVWQQLRCAASQKAYKSTDYSSFLLAVHTQTNTWYKSQRHAQSFWVSSWLVSLQVKPIKWREHKWQWKCTQSHGQVGTGWRRVMPGVIYHPSTLVYVCFIFTKYFAV